MAENKQMSAWKLFLTELPILILGTGGVWLFGSLRELEQDRLLGSCVMTLLGLAVTGFHFRREYLGGKLDYNNKLHVFRFWFCVGMGLIVAFACGFLPVEGWPFLVVFVMLALFGNMSTSLLATSILLMIAMILSGGSELNFALYLVSGAFAVALFQHLENGFHFGIPFFLSLLCLFVCETAGVVLVTNARPDPELFVIPAVNVIVSGILLLGLMKLFSSLVLYQFREKYLDVNDPENPVLAELREENRREYMYGIHTAYFCERIGMLLGLNADAMKCAAYYHRLGGKVEEMIESKQFPPVAREILQEYLTNREHVRKKETAVLIFSEKVVTSVSSQFQGKPDIQVDYQKLIDSIFEEVRRTGILEECNITMEEFYIMYRTFREEKLYYDFLR